MGLLCLFVIMIDGLLDWCVYGCVDVVCLFVCICQFMVSWVYFWEFVLF